VIFFSRGRCNRKLMPLVRKYKIITYYIWLNFKNLGTSLDRANSKRVFLLWKFRLEDYIQLNRTTAGSIPARGPIVAFFANAPG
jgi:hypothetical protein